MPWTSAGHGSFANASSTALSLRLIHPAARLSAQQPHPGEFMRRIALGLLVTTTISGPVLAAPIQTVFVVGMENHNLTQPGSFNSIQQILGNSAAPYLNSLMTPGNQNAKYTSVRDADDQRRTGDPSVRAELHLGKWWLELRGCQRCGSGAGQRQCHHLAEHDRADDQQGHPLEVVPGRRAIFDFAVEERFGHRGHRAQRCTGNHKSV